MKSFNEIGLVIINVLENDTSVTDFVETVRTGRRQVFWCNSRSINTGTFIDYLY